MPCKKCSRKCHVVALTLISARAMAARASMACVVPWTSVPPSARIMGIRTWFWMVLACQWHMVVYPTFCMVKWAGLDSVTATLQFEIDGSRSYLLAQEVLHPHATVRLVFCRALSALSIFWKGLCHGSLVLRTWWWAPRRKLGCHYSFPSKSW